MDFSEIDLDDPEAQMKYTEGLDKVARQLFGMGTTSFGAYSHHPQKEALQACEWSTIIEDMNLSL